MQLTAGHLYEFGPFVLDTNRHLLLLQGRPVPLTPKTYDLLVVLVENSGRVILKDELMKMVWVDSFVEDSNLTQQISAVRKALGETAGEDRYIVTVPGKGYRFAAAVTEPVVKEQYATGRAAVWGRWRQRAEWRPSPSWSLWVIPYFEGRYRKVLEASQSCRSRA